MYNVQHREEVDAAIPEFMMANGIPFNVYRSRFCEEMKMKIIDVGPGYIPPSHSKLKTTVLEKAVLKMKQST